MIDFIIEYWLQFIFGIIITLIISMYKRINKHYKTIKTIKDGLKTLLKSKIISEYNRISKNNYISVFEKEIINELYTEYTLLGGNGVIKDIVLKINNLKIGDLND